MHGKSRKIEIEDAIAINSFGIPKLVTNKVRIAKVPPGTGGIAQDNKNEVIIIAIIHVTLTAVPAWILPKYPVAQSIRASVGQYNT